MVGCGNSQLSADMYDVGYKNITNIDTSEVVIRQMISKNLADRPTMTFHKMNVMNVSFLLYLLHTELFLQFTIHSCK